MPVRRPFGDCIVDAGSMPPTGNPELDELHDAARRFRSEAASAASSPRRVSIVAPLVCALVVGAAAWLLVPGRYLAEAHFDAPPAGRAAVRSRLEAALVALRGDSAHGDNPSAVSPSWNVLPTAAGLQLRVWAGDATSARRAIEDLITDVRKNDAGATEAVPEELVAARELLRERLVELGAQVQAASKGSAASAESASPGIPAAVRAERLSQEARVRTALDELDRLREECGRLEKTRAELEATDPVLAAAVLDEDREKSYDADEMLRQDRQQLAAELVNARRAMLDVKQQAAGFLDEALTAAGDLREAAAQRGGLAELSAQRESLSVIAAKTSAHAELAEVFLADWARLHAVLEEAESGAIMERLQRIDERGRQFCFDAAQSLEEITASLNAMREQVGLTTAAQTALSELSKRCAAARTALGRFEAKAIKQRPVRLQASLEAAARLRDRVRDRMATVDRQVFEEAIEAARKQRVASLAETANQLETARGALLQRGNELEPLISEWTAQWNREVEAASRAADAKAGAADLARLQDEERRTREMLDALSRLRAAAADPLAGVQIRGPTVMGDPQVTRTRLQVGGVAGVLSLVAGLLVQGLTARPRRSA
ncbi:MAG: hypothetical protein IT449_12320 [Phycisphaerales bacterium]|nr:hypothetical protein [Phycisphaerales bacterium]